MRITFLFFITSLLCTCSTAQPELKFNVVSLSGPGLQEPVDLTGSGDGSGRLFIVEKKGTIRIIQNGNVRSDYFLDIRTQVMNSGERGLLGLAFHPKYPDSAYIYVNYVITGTITTRISRFTLNPNNPNDIDESTQLILFSQPGVQSNHKAGDLAFGPDGYLYIGMGDGGGGFDPNNNGQDNEILLAKMLRIDINTATPPLNYSIPPDNPFVGKAGLDEIWANGLRNPWRISFDRLTGDFWIADVGQNEWEEVDMIPAGTPGGMNFGWDCQEGNHPSEPQNCPGNPTFTWPIFEYPHDCPCPIGHGVSLTGGFVYRGNQYPALKGYYICADYGSNYYWMIKKTGSNPLKFNVFAKDGSGEISELVTFGEDDNGELYACNLSGTLYAISSPSFAPLQWDNVSFLKIPSGNKINWSLHQTSGINYFEAQWSSDPGFQNYSVIATIQSTLDQTSYSCIDSFPQPTSIYYRIAAYMLDGTTSFSPIIKTLGDPTTRPALVYDLNGDKWELDIPVPWRNGLLTLYDLQGKEIYHQRITSDQRVEFTKTVIPGCYFVKISGNMGTWIDRVIL